MHVVKQSKMYESTYPYHLHPNKYNQELHYHPFAVNLYRYALSCNTLDYLSNKVCGLNETEDLNLHFF